MTGRLDVSVNIIDSYMKKTKKTEIREHIHRNYFIFLVRTIWVQSSAGGNSRWQNSCIHVTTILLL